MQFLSSLQVSFLKSESQEFRSLIDELYSLPMVRFAVINDSYGERLVGGMKPGVQSISPDESEKRLAMQSVIMLKMAEDFEKYTGELHYSTIRWDKMKAIFFLLSPERAVTVTIYGDTPLEQISKVENVVRNWKKYHA